MAFYPAVLRRQWQSDVVVVSVDAERVAVRMPDRCAVATGPLRTARAVHAGGESVEVTLEKDAPQGYGGGGREQTTLLKLVSPYAANIAEAVEIFQG